MEVKLSWGLLAHSLKADVNLEPIDFRCKRRRLTGFSSAEECEGGLAQTIALTGRVRQRRWARCRAAVLRMCSLWWRVPVAAVYLCTWIACTVKAGVVSTQIFRVV